MRWLLLLLSLLVLSPATSETAPSEEDNDEIDDDIFDDSVPETEKKVRIIHVGAPEKDMAHPAGESDDVKEEVTKSMTIDDDEPVLPTPPVMIKFEASDAIHPPVPPDQEKVVEEEPEDEETKMKREMYESAAALLNSSSGDKDKAWELMGESRRQLHSIFDTFVNP